MGLLPDTSHCGLRMRRECRGRFARHRPYRKPLVSDPDMHHGTCVTHVPWCMSWSLTRGGGENVPGIPGACATRNFTYLVRGPWSVRTVLTVTESTLVFVSQANICTLQNQMPISQTVYELTIAIFWDSFLLLGLPSWLISRKKT